MDLLFPSILLLRSESLYTAEVENRPKSAHRYNVAEQQQIYKSEIERIWKAQFDSLSRKEPPQLTPEEESRGKKPPSPPLLVTSRKDLQHSHAPSPGPNGTSTANDSRGSSMDPNAEQEAKDRNRVLRIKRLVSTLSI
jgi:transcription initiation factor TFIID subunit 1